MSLMDADHVPIKSNTGGEQWLIEQQQVSGDEQAQVMGTGQVWYESDTAEW